MTQTTTQTARDPLEEIVEQIPELAPLDEHNRELVSNAHPPEWKNPEPAKRYNLVVIGGGTAALRPRGGRRPRRRSVRRHRG